MYSTRDCGLFRVLNKFSHILLIAASRCSKLLNYILCFVWPNKENKSPVWNAAKKISTLTNTKHKYHPFYDDKRDKEEHLPAWNNANNNLSQTPCIVIIHFTMKDNIVWMYSIKSCKEILLNFVCYVTISELRWYGIWYLRIGTHLSEDESQSSLADAMACRRASGTDVARHNGGSPTAGKRKKIVNSTTQNDVQGVYKWFSCSYFKHL